MCIVSSTYDDDNDDDDDDCTAYVGSLPVTIHILYTYISIAYIINLIFK